MIRSFSHTHLVGAGICDYGQLGIMPISVPPSASMLSNRAFYSDFSHVNESAHPGYYQVELLSHKINVEIAATSNAAVHRYTWRDPKASKTILIDLAHAVLPGSIDSAQATINARGENEISGSILLKGPLSRRFGGFTLYFSIMFPVPWMQFGTFNSSTTLEKTKQNLMNDLSLFMTSRSNSKSSNTAYRKDANGMATVTTIFPWSTEVHGSGKGGDGSLGLYVVLPDNLPQNQVEFFVGISSISEEFAKSNIQTQISSSLGSFDKVRSQAESQWEKILSKVIVHSTTSATEELSSNEERKVENSEKSLNFLKKESDFKEIYRQASKFNSGEPSRDEMVQFYSAMYRTHMAPTQFDEYDAINKRRAYRGFDKKIHFLPSTMEHYYSDMSIWDTFRSEMPWLTLLNYQLSTDAVNSLGLMFEKGGDLPRWPMADGYTNCMIGTHAIIVITDSGMRGAHVKSDLLYAAMLQAATKRQENAGRTDLEHYLSKGWVTYESTSKGACHTLEYAYDDWALGNYASKFMGDETSAKKFWNRSLNYRHVWSSKDQIFCARKVDGEFLCPSTWINVFDPTYVEGDAWHWRWFVPHDPQGLIQLFGSSQLYIQQLDYFMNKSIDFPNHLLPNPYYWAGNEPDIFAPWMFSFGGRPDLTQKWTRYIVDTQYSSSADGVPGNDDFGTLSAWYLFAVLGFYPQAGSDLYIVGSPKFSHVTINRPSDIGNLEIFAYSASPSNIYVSEMRINGKAIDLKSTPWFSHDLISSSSKIEFWMTDKPS